ncbi:hypothetical protein EON79_03015 [bacterium]|nr:MAG: hypothetical protein EON79_03015 [bacterium]
MAVEVKGMPHSSALDIDLWATSLRRNLVVHAAIPKTPFFLLLAMPDYGFLWSSPEKSAEAPPDYRIYLPSTGLNFASNSKGYDSQAEGMAAGFLQALVEGRLDTSEDWWKESGLRYYIEKRHLKVVREGPQNVRGLA